MRRTVREVNLELGMPTVAAALARMDNELQFSRRSGYRVVKLIHGYGSSGKGGKIRVSVRRELQRRKQQGQLKEVIFGEQFSIFETATLSALSVAPDLRKDRDLNRYNNGVTFLVF